MITLDCQVLKPDGSGYTRATGDGTSRSGHGWYRVWLYWRAGGHCPEQGGEGEVALGFRRVVNMTDRLAEDKYKDALDLGNDSYKTNKTVTDLADMLARATVSSHCPATVTLQLASRTHRAPEVGVTVTTDHQACIFVP